MWKIKVLVQFILAHIPYGEHLNHLLQRANIALRGGLSKSTATRIGELCDGFSKISRFKNLNDISAVEVGTGWGALPTVFLRAAGARDIYTYDHVRHLRRSWMTTAVEQSIAASEAIAAATGNSAGDVRDRMTRLLAPAESSIDGILNNSGIHYVAPGDAARTGLPDHSIDLYYSHAVLEHVPEQAVDSICQEARRILKPDGLFYALIGLHDHYNRFGKSVSKVNFLQYPEWLWAFFVKNSISYHNRLRERDFLDKLKANGAEIVSIWSKVDYEDVSRVQRMKIDTRFSGYTSTELATTCTEIIARFPSAAR